MGFCICVFCFYFVDVHDVALKSLLKRDIICVKFVSQKAASG